jgi:hypothetical protein
MQTRHLASRVWYMRDAQSETTDGGNCFVSNHRGIEGEWGVIS